MRTVCKQFRQRDCFFKRTAKIEKNPSVEIFF